MIDSARRLVTVCGAALCVCLAPMVARNEDSTVVDTGQETCFDDTASVDAPLPGEPFHGQDAQHERYSPAYVASEDGLTVDDLRTGLTWQRDPDLDGDGEIDSSGPGRPTRQRAMATTTS